MISFELKSTLFSSEQFARLKRYFPNLYFDWKRVVIELKSGKDADVIWKDIGGKKVVDIAEAKKAVETWVEKEKRLAASQEEEDEDEDEDYNYDASLKERDRFIRAFSLRPEYRPYLGETPSSSRFPFFFLPFLPFLLLTLPFFPGPYLTDEFVEELLESPEETLFRIGHVKDRLEEEAGRKRDSQVVEEAETLSVGGTQGDALDAKEGADVDDDEEAEEDGDEDRLEAAAEEEEEEALDDEGEGEREIEEMEGFDVRDMLAGEDDPDMRSEIIRREEERKKNLEEFIEGLPGMDWERSQIIERFNHVKNADKREAKSVALNENTWPHGDLKKLRAMMEDEKKKDRPIKNKRVRLQISRAGLDLQVFAF
jgi:hypothetical protein